ncbi:MAG: hypothetical protein HWN80_10565 [Candidatus Lokiarchaeota archaeon]|nr:hypothetical protein [Candidatus Lokiarchaeota archaeon]
MSENKLNTDIELTRIKPKLEELELKLMEANNTIANLEGELKFTSEKNNEMEQSIKFKDKQIENSKEEIIKRKKEIDILTENNKANQKETEELIKKLNSLESKLTEVRTSPKILERIRETLVHKGFITDREIDNIFKEFE